MHLLRHLSIAALLLVVTSVPARADGLIVPFVGYNYGGDSGGDCLSLTNCKEKRTNFGVSFVSMGPVFGLEEDISYAKNFFGDTPGAGQLGLFGDDQSDRGRRRRAGAAVCPRRRRVGSLACLVARRVGHWPGRCGKATPSGTTSASG